MNNLYHLQTDSQGVHQPTHHAMHFILFTLESLLPKPTFGVTRDRQNTKLATLLTFPVATLYVN